MSVLSTSIPGLVSTSASSTTDEKRAASTVTTPETKVQAISVNVELFQAGTIVGKTRYFDEDMASTVAQQAIFKESNKIAVDKTIAAGNNIQSVVSAEQAVEQWRSIGLVSENRQNDIIRSMQKVQRTCNHKYDRSSKRCIYCTKHKDSHVYDVGSKSLLS